MNTRFLPVIIFCLYLTNLNDGARILGVFPFGAPSHYILASGLLKGLAEAGHDVTIISPFTEKEPPKKGTWREIVLADSFEALGKIFKKTSLSQMAGSNPLFTLGLLNMMWSIVTENTLNNTKVQQLIKSNEKFDVVIVGQFGSDAFKAFANHFDAHLILLSNQATNSWVNPLVGNPVLPSMLPELMWSFPPTMSFFQRLQNTLLHLVITLNSHLFVYPKQNELIQKYFPNPVDLYDILYNASLVLLNSHPSTSNVSPFVPCMIEIGGYHIKPPKKLPDDLQKFLDDAKEGAIYFSMGSNLKSANLPSETRDAILKAFGKRKEKILWKWEDDVLPGQPPNVKVSKWVPQQDVLAHPNIKVFLTHGGYGSTVETIYHGVPIVAIPIAGDQKANAYAAQNGGYGIVLPYEDISEEKLTSLLDEVINNPKYRENVKTRSNIMKDRQVHPLDNAVYWVEYVIRHNGAKHLRVAYLDLAWYQYYLLDVIGFVFGSIFVIFIVLKKLLSYVCKRKAKTTKLKTN